MAGLQCRARQLEANAARNARDDDFHDFDLPVQTELKPEVPEFPPEPSFAVVNNVAQVHGDLTKSWPVGRQCANRSHMFG
jgi:hypothetical protein